VLFQENWMVHRLTKNWKAGFQNEMRAPPQNLVSLYTLKIYFVKTIRYGFLQFQIKGGTVLKINLC